MRLSLIVIPLWGRLMRKERLLMGLLIMVISIFRWNFPRRGLRRNVAISMGFICRRRSDPRMRRLGRYYILTNGWYLWMFLKKYCSPMASKSSIRKISYNSTPNTEKTNTTVSFSAGWGWFSTKANPSTPICGKSPTCTASSSAENSATALK